MNNLILINYTIAMNYIQKEKVFIKMFKKFKIIINKNKKLIQGNYKILSFEIN